MFAWRPRIHPHQRKRSLQPCLIISWTRNNMWLLFLPRMLSIYHPGSGSVLIATKRGVGIGCLLSLGIVSWKKGVGLPENGDQELDRQTLKTVSLLDKCQNGKSSDHIRLFQILIKYFRPWYSYSISALCQVLLSSYQNTIWRMSRWSLWHAVVGDMMLFY